MDPVISSTLNIDILKKHKNKCGNFKLPEDLFRDGTQHLES